MRFVSFRAATGEWLIAKQLQSGSTARSLRSGKRAQSESECGGIPERKRNKFRVRQRDEGKEQSIRAEPNRMHTNERENILMRLKEFWGITLTHDSAHFIFFPADIQFLSFSLASAFDCLLDRFFIFLSAAAELNFWKLEICFAYWKRSDIQTGINDAAAMKPNRFFGKTEWKLHQMGGMKPSRMQQ